VSVYACELPPTQIKPVLRKTIVLWGHEDVLGHSVEILLGARKDWTLVRVPEYRDIDQFCNEVDKIKPDVVVIYNRGFSSDIILPIKLIANHEWIKVVIVNLDNNSVEVVSKQKVVIQEDSDLLSIVEGCPRLPCPADNL